MKCVIHTDKGVIYQSSFWRRPEWCSWWAAWGQSWSVTYLSPCWWRPGRVILLMNCMWTVCDPQLWSVWSTLISLLVDAWQSDLASELQWDKVCGPQLWSVWSTITKCDLPISLLVKARAILLMSCRGTKCVIHKSRALHESVPVFSDRWAFMSNPHMDTQPSCESKHADDKTAWVCPHLQWLVSLKTAKPSCPVPT